ncbi:ATP-binding protein, partial [Paenibacillus thalictri]|uniref:ATP-binding protein n=1 Tax=Paenibacillus thalictri TaxID=2527873 RepID=UPI003B83243D
RELAARHAQLAAREAELRERQGAGALPLRALEQERAALRAGWRSWRERCRLGGEVSPEATLEQLQLAEQAEQLVRQKQKSAARRDALAEQAAQFEQAVCRHLGSAAASDPVTALKLWKERAAEYERGQTAKRYAAEQREELAAQQSLAESQLERLDRRLRQLLEQGDAQDAEQLRVRARQHAQRQTLEQERSQLAALLAGWGCTDEGSAVGELLKGYDKPGLSALEDVKQREWNEAEEDLQASRTQCARLEQEAERLEGAERGSRLQTLEEHKAELKQLTLRYAALSMCSALFASTKQLYEKERQPAVIQRASEYFRMLTCGTFVRIVSPIGETTLLAQRLSGEMLETSQLSRGTAEQLYLAMRLALADDYARHVQLPLVMDDIFVNFDIQRLQGSLAALREMSQRQQVLMFTCHEHVVSEARRLVPELHLIEL